MENQPSNTEEIKIDRKYRDYHKFLLQEDKRLKAEMGDKYEDFIKDEEDDEIDVAEDDEDDLDDEDDCELLDLDYKALKLSNDKKEKKMKNEKKERKKERKDKSSVNGLEAKPKFNPLDKLNKMETKSNVSNSLVKMLVDTVACLFIAPAVSAVTGKYAPLVGGAINFSGHYVGDQSGLLRAVGMGTMVHGMAKVNEYRSEDSTVKSRFCGIKDDWLKCFLNKDPESKKNELINSETKSLELPEDTKQVSGVPSKNTLTFIDPSYFDNFDTFKSKQNAERNDSFELSRKSEQEIDDFDLDENLDFDDDDIDFSRY